MASDLPASVHAHRLQRSNCTARPSPRAQAVEELLQREVDPAGERYSLSKVLHTCQASGEGQAGATAEGSS